MADRFQRYIQTPQPAQPLPRSPRDTAVPSAPSVSQVLRQMQVEQAPSSTTRAGADYQWATLKVDAIIGGHTFRAGTRIVVSPAQTSQSVIGKAHTSVSVTKVWAKFGQTFDASSWISGTLSPSVYTLTGQAATWQSSVGFGADAANPPDTGMSTGTKVVLVVGVLAAAGGIVYLATKKPRRRRA